MGLFGRGREVRWDYGFLAVVTVQVESPWITGPGILVTFCQKISKLSARKIINNLTEGMAK